MKQGKNKLITTLLAVTMALSLTACGSKENIDDAIAPVNEQITAIDGYVDELEEKVETLEVELSEMNTALEENESKMEELERENAELKEQIIILNCLNGLHELSGYTTDGNGAHKGVCEHCEQEITEDCVYGDLIENENGTKSKTCSTCNHTSVTFTKIWEDKLTLDLSVLLNITDETAVYTLISTPSTNYGSIDGVILSCPLKGDYVMTVTVDEIVTHTFTVSITNNPATDEFEGEWA